jgi:predicted transcriptional regulator
MSLKTITFRAPEEKVSALDALAEVHKRDRSFLINEAVDQYLSLNDYHRELIEEGIRQDDDGQLIDHARVRHMAAGWAAKAKKK